MGIETSHTGFHVSVELVFFVDIEATNGTMESAVVVSSVDVALDDDVVFVIDVDDDIGEAGVGISIGETTTGNSVAPAVCEFSLPVEIGTEVTRAIVTVKAIRRIIIFFILLHIECKKKTIIVQFV